MDAALTVAAQPGLGLGARRRRPAPARQPPSEHHAVRDVRGADRPLAVAVGNDRLFARLCEALGLRRAGRPTSASPPTPRASRTPTRWPSGSRRCCARAPAAEWVDALRAAAVPAGPINDVAEAFALAESLGLEPVGEAGGYAAAGAAAAARRRAPGDPPAAAAARRARRRAARLAAGRRSWLGACAATRHLLADGLRQHEAHVLAQHLELRDVARAARAEEVDEPLDELLGRARAGRDADHARALEPLLAHLELVVDQVRVGAGSRARRRRAGWSSTSCASRSPARGRTARPSA